MQKLINQENSFFQSSNIDSSCCKIDPKQRAWIEVNSKAISKNARKIKEFIGEECLLMAVVKADGYGHGLVTVANAALEGGADNLGVATLQEGIDLRQAGLDCKILLLGNLISKQDLNECINWDLTPTLSGIREAIICQNLAKNRGSEYRMKVHLKVDTGMARLGCDLQDAPFIVEKIDRFNNVELDGVYSHLALADEVFEDDFGNFTELQRERFELLIQQLSSRKKKISFHLANSAGTLINTGLHYDMVRIGLALYGHSPYKESLLPMKLEPALSVKARVTLIRDVLSGVGVGYGHNFITKRETRLAVVAIGYADGVSRALSGKIYASIDGKLFPQVGAITMDQLVLDITDKSDIKVGSVVTLLGRDNEVCITPNQWSSLTGSIPWEILCGFKHRLPRLVI